MAAAAGTRRPVSARPGSRRRAARPGGARRLRRPAAGGRSSGQADESEGALARSWRARGPGGDAMRRRGTRTGGRTGGRAARGNAVKQGRCEGCGRPRRPLLSRLFPGGRAGGRRETLRAGGARRRGGPQREGRGGCARDGFLGGLGLAGAGTGLRWPRDPRPAGRKPALLVVLSSPPPQPRGARVAPRREQSSSAGRPGAEPRVPNA